MAITLPKYGTVVPSETTRFRDLGKELREFGESIEGILESFDYNGADPNLVLSRVAALEAWRTTTQDRLSLIEATLETKRVTPWKALTELVTPSSPFSNALANLYLRRNGDRVECRGHIVNGNAYTTWTALTSTDLPLMYRPTQAAIIGGDTNSTAVRTLEISTSGSIRAFSSVASGGWWSFTGKGWYSDHPIT